MKKISFLFFICLSGIHFTLSQSLPSNISIKPRNPSGLNVYKGVTSASDLFYYISSDKKNNIEVIKDNGNHQMSIKLNGDALDLAVDQLVDFFTGQIRVGLEAAQDAHVRQPHPERAAVTNELELYQVRFVVEAVAVGLARRQVEQSFTLVEAHRFHVAVAALCQFADPHCSLLQKVLDPVPTKDCSMMAPFPEICHHESAQPAQTRVSSARTGEGRVLHVRA